MSRHNKTLASHLQAVQGKEAKGSRMQAHYLSPETQNEFIEECGKSVLRTVVDEVKKALYYSIITDGTPDVSHTEQITFVLRFVKRNENNSWEVFERFLKVEAMEKKKGLDIANLICDVLKEHEIDLKNCRGQGYDNGSNMAGIYKGAQARILAKNPQATFISCAGHNANLAGVHAAESSVVVMAFFGNIQLLYNIFSGSPARWKILQETAKVSLHTLSKTRWSARIEAVRPLTQRPREIANALELLTKLDLTADVKNQVTSLIKWIKSFEYVVLVTFWFKVLHLIDDFSRVVQSRKITLDEELRLFNLLISDLVRLRNSWPNILEESRLVATNLDFATEFVEKRVRRRRIRHNEPDTAHYHSQPEKEFEVEVFNVALDNVLEQFRQRFETIEKINSIFAFIWSDSDSEENGHGLDVEENNDLPLTLEDKVQALVKLYPNDLSEEEFVVEIRHFKRIKQTLFGANLNPVELLNKIYAKDLQTLFPLICISLRMFACMPVSAAEGERSFSKLAIVKNALRSTMGQNRLSHLLTLTIESDLAKKISHEEIISNFAQKKARRVANLKELSIVPSCPSTLSSSQSRSLEDDQVIMVDEEENEEIETEAAEVEA